MTLRRKLLLILGASLTGLVFLLYVVSYNVLIGSYLTLENAEVQRNVQRVMNGLNDEINNLSNTVADWAYWDDTYQFMQDHNPQYLDTNIPTTTFTNLKVNVMMFIDPEGRLLFGKALDVKANQLVDLPTNLEPYTTPASPLFAKAKTDNPTGIVMLDGSPMLIASRAVLTTEKKGPVKGTVIFGRFLNDEKIAQIAESTQLTIAIQNVAAPDLPADFKTLAGRVQTGSTLVEPQNDDIVNGYSLLNDISGSPALYLKIQQPRDIYTQGRVSLNTFVLAVLAVGVLIMGLTLILIERLVLARLAALRSEVALVTASGDPTARVSVTFNDELTSLGNDINTMLGAIEQGQVAVRKNEERLQKLVDELQQSQAELNNNDHQLQITVSSLEKQKRQFQRLVDVVRTTMLQMQDGLLRSAPTDELAGYVKKVQAQIETLNQDK